jgi:hypothetical protein
MEDVVIFHGHFVIWYFYGHLVHFFRFGMLYQEKSGNSLLNPSHSKENV